MIGGLYYLFLFLTVSIATSEEKMKASRVIIYLLVSASLALEGNYIWKKDFDYH